MGRIHSPCALRTSLKAGHARAFGSKRIALIAGDLVAHFEKCVEAMDGKVNAQTDEMSYGFASNLRDALPNALFIGFNGTPIEKSDANTRAVFGDLASQARHESVAPTNR